MLSNGSRSTDETGRGINMQISRELLHRTLVSGAAAGVATTITALLAGKREAGSYGAPLNATSHAVWGDVAAQQDDISLKFTGIGLLFHGGAAMFWAGLYEKWLAPRIAARFRHSSLGPMASAAAVTAAAYVTDYYLVPKRLTPGFEKRVSGRSLAMIYGALALGFFAGSMINERREA
jgi:hypothetical protein